MGKQGELMEQMAKAQRDRKKRELEEKLRESGDLPPAEDAPKVRERERERILKTEATTPATAAVSASCCRTVVLLLDLEGVRVHLFDL